MTFDVCIIGAGPAGIICGLELSRLRPDLKILLLEYGDAVPGENSLDATIKIGNPINHHPPSECTNKGFGGTSATWGGRCVSYDEIDFVPRRIIGDGCTWNLDVFQQAREFYPVASEYMECGPPRFTFEECFPEDRSNIAENFRSGDITDHCLERWSMPTRFGPRYRETVSQRPNLTYREGVEVVRLEPQEDHSIEVQGRLRESGDACAFLCGRVVISTGAQEATRLLFKSERLFTQSGGLPDSLGKYYQGHVSGKIASVVFTGNPKKTDFGFLMDQEIFVRRRFQLSKELLLKEDLLNTALWLDNPLYSDPRHKNGTMSFIYLMMLLPILGRRLAPPAIAHSITKGKKQKLGPHFKNILMGFPRSFIEPASIFLRRYLTKRKLPGVFLYNSTNSYALHFHAEQVPLAENRMVLAEDGTRLQIDYTYAEEDVNSVIRTHRLLDEWLRATGAGRLEYWYPDEDLKEKIKTQSRDGIHQVGTTRMSLSPEDGVVDCDLRLWANPNVFVCSSSTFPTSGQANPTFLLAAFAARLAQNLSQP